MVDILMATYNGEKYVKNQILSILQQTYDNFRLLIRDDGSCDSTVNIVREISKFDSRICLIEEGAGQKLGPGKNFMGLLQYATSDYAIFCDQDDIWFEKKLEILVRFAQCNFNPATPCLVYCDAYAYSSMDGCISMEGVSPFHAKNLREFIFFNSGYQGASMLFNRSLIYLAKDYKASYMYMHDDIVSLLAHVFGEVFFVPNKLMFYRQHCSNFTGNINNNLINRVIKILKCQSSVLSKRHYEEKRSFFESYKDMISADDKKVFCSYINYPLMSRKQRLMTVWRNRFSYGGNRWLLVLKTLLQKPMS